MNNPSTPGIGTRQCRSSARGTRAGVSYSASGAQLESERLKELAARSLRSLTALTSINPSIRFLISPVDGWNRVLSCCTTSVTRSLCCIVLRPFIIRTMHAWGQYAIHDAA